MAIKVLPGRISGNIRLIEKAESVTLHYSGPTCRLVVVEDDDTRLLPISREAFEVLAAYGMSYGN